MNKFKDVIIFKKHTFHDERGFFKEIYKQELPYCNFLQDNYSFTRKKNTFRGLHYQENSNAQAKIISILQGKVLDIIVDLRPQSETFGKIGALELTKAMQLFIPKGFAHGFLTLTNNVACFYKCDEFYNHEKERGVNILSAEFDFVFKNFNRQDFLLSNKDRALPNLQLVLNALSKQCKQ